MSGKDGGIIFSRLIVLISIIVVPIIIFLIFIFNDFHLWFYNDPVVEFWVIKLLCPFIFSVSWLFFLILFANRVSETLETMDKTISIVPLRLKLFYGINALFIMCIFVFPLITPFISIISFMAMAWRLTTFRKEEWDDSGAPSFTRVLMGFAAIIPIFCTIVILPDYIALSVFLFTQIWIPLLDFIFIISLCLCTALAIGALIVFFQNSGISEYEQLLSMPSQEKKRIASVRFFEFSFFLFLLFLAFGKFLIIDLFYNVGFFVVLFVSIVNFFKGRSKDKAFKGHLFGYLLAAVFMGSNLVFINVAYSDLIKVWTLIISASLFTFVFFYVFITLEEDEFLK